MTARSRAALKLVLTMALVSLVVVLAKDTLNKISFLSFLYLQMMVAVIATSVYSFIISREKFPANISRKEWLLVIAIGILNFSLVKFIFIYALELIPVTTHAYIMNFVGIVTLLLSVMLLKEKPLARQLIGSLIAIFGLWLYFYESPSSTQIKGVIALSFAVFCLALTNICMRQLHLLKGRKLSDKQVTAISLLFGGIPIIIYGAFHDLALMEIKLWDWLIIIANGLIAVAYIILVFVQVLKHLKAYEASILATSGVIFTAIFAMPLLGDYLTAYEGFGMLLMFVGLVLVHKIS